jgi:transcriptional regulator with XRE-family HTH domain
MGVRRSRKRRPDPLSASGIVAINLKRARELRGLSQAEAGDLLGDFLRNPWSAATVSAAERSWERGPERSFTANELDGFSRAFRLPVIWFLLPPSREEADGRPLPQRWVRRLLWSDSSELDDHVEELARDRRAAALAGIMDTAEDTLANALAGHRDDRLRGLARQLREVAGTLDRAGGKRSRRARHARG